MEGYGRDGNPADPPPGSVADAETELKGLLRIFTPQ